jgi:UDP-N-acetylglucosamine 4,6-dehydratase/5-epimerase
MKGGKAKITITQELKNKTILITGGAGSIGGAITKKLLQYPVRSVRVLDIDEHALFRLKREVNDKRVRYLLGSVLDKQRIEMAGLKADIIIHTAAVKNIEISEFNPIQTIETNITGTVNMINMCMTNKPKKFLNISTDKAADATTLYGTTKNIGEKLTSWAGSHVSPTKFASARFGNVIETRGNVFEVWNEENKEGRPLSITDPNMKRYFFNIEQAVSFVLECLLEIKNGEIFIPKMKLFKVVELANKISKNHKIIGVRKGEKMNEILMNSEEKDRSIEKKNMWIIKQI